MTFTQKCRVAFAALVTFAAGLAYAQGAPTTLVFVKSTVGLQLQSITYTGAAEVGQPLSGQGTLVISALGQDIPTGTVPFAGVVCDASGNVKLNQTGYTFQNIKFPVPGTGLNVSCPACTIVVSATPSISISGDLTVDLPYKDENGDPMELTTKGAGNAATTQIVVDSTGFNLNATKLAVTGATNSVTLAGFTIQFQSPTVQFHSGQTPKLQVDIPEADVDTPLPGLQLGGNLDVEGQNIHITETGAPTMQLSLKQGQASVCGRAATPLVFTLSQPLNFGVEITALSIQVQNGLFADQMLSAAGASSGTSSSITAQIILPHPPLSDGNGNAAMLPPATIAMKNGAFDISCNQSWPANAPFVVACNLGGSETFKLNLTQLTFDSQVGVQNVSGTAELDGDSDFQSLSSGQPLQLTLQNVSIDHNGISGTFGISNLSLASIKCQGGSVTIDRSALVGGAATATLDVGLFQPINLTIGISKSGGMTFTVNGNQTVTVPGGFLTLNLTSGSGSIDSNHNLSFALSGSAQITADGWSAQLEFDDLGVTNGKITAGAIDLAKPITVPVGPIDVHVQSMAVNMAGSSPSVHLDGDVDFPDYLPISGNVTFDGLTVGSSGVSIDGLGCLAQIDGVGELGINFNKGSPQSVNGFTNVLEADANLTLDALNDVGMNGGFFLSDGNAWVADANIDLGVPIVIVPVPVASNLSIEFGGAGVGVGYHVTPTGNGISNAPLEQQFKLDPSSDVFVDLQGDLQTADMFTLWGQVGGSLQTGNDSGVKIYGNLGCLWPNLNSYQPDSQHEMDFAMGYWNSAIRFDGSLTWSLLNLITLSGGIDAAFNSSSGYVNIGWPLDTNGIGVTTNIANVVSASAKQGLGLTFYPNTQFQYGLNGSAKFSLSVLNASGNITLNVGLRTVQNGMNLSFSGSAGASVSICGIGAWASGSLSGSLTCNPMPSSGSLNASLSAGISLPFVGNVGFNTGNVTIVSW